MRRPRLTYANVVSTLCLFVVLGGSAWAAKTQLARNRVGTPQLKANAVTGAKVKNGSLTGADDAAHATSADSAGHASTAGSADHATSADTAGEAADAAALGGEPASSFVLRSDLRRVFYEAHWESEPTGPRTVLSVGPLTLSAVCFESETGGAHTYLELRATGAAGSTLDYSLTVGGSVKVGSVPLEPAASTGIETIYSEDPGSTDGSMTLVYQDPARTISMPLALFAAGDSDVCRVTGSAVVAES